MDAETYAIIRLARSSGIGQKTFRLLVQAAGSASEAVQNFPQLQKELKIRQEIGLIDRSKVDDELAKLTEIGASIITYRDQLYPKLLKQIYDFPLTITFLGNIELARKSCVAIVGSRNCSANGFRYSYNLAKQAFAENYVVVSGLALGIDTAAHKAAPNNTIACVAGGVNHVYPEENRGLYEQIAEQGLIISEMPLNTIPKATNFPMRNRIISGLSLATIVVEAAINSGSLITASCALEQNRDVYAVPTFPGDPRSRGTIKLLKEGAFIMENFADLKEQVAIAAPQKMKQNEAIEENLLTDKVLNRDIESIVMQQVGLSETSIDDIIAITGYNSYQVMAVISKLELDGKLLRQNYNKVIKIA